MKKWADIILIVAVLFSLGAIIAYFMTEGFQTRLTQAEANARMGADSTTVCMAQKSCSTCADDKAHPGTQCGWCTAAQACVPRSGIYRIIPEWLMNIINLDPTKDCPPNPANGQDNFVYSKGACTDATCTDYTNCRDCAGALACGWSVIENKCYNKISYANPVSGSGGSGGSVSSGSVSSAPGSRPPLTTQSGSCPPPVCSSITDCGMCTSTTGCGFCKDTSKCIQVDGNGSSLGGSSGSSGCAQGSIYTQMYQCPCSNLTSCTDCAQRPGCGYCTTSSTCINIEAPIRINGNTPSVSIPPERLPCAANKIATSTAQCLPGATIPNLMADPRNSGSPSANELAMAQDSGLLGGNELNVQGSYGGPRGTGGGAVSPPSMSQYVSGNGAVRPMNAPMPGGTRSFDLDGNPIQDYIKTLVRSELASQGVPMNEPFIDVISTLGSLFKY
jgi:hypothetical protein